MITGREIQITEDGSHTIFNAEMNVAYHSKHGAIQESMHVFIQSGLIYFINKNPQQKYSSINIFEVGFGTGLNALLSLQQSITFHQKIFYQSLEPHPLSIKKIEQLNYTQLLNKELQQNFIAMHEGEWNKEISIHPLFSLKKMKTGLQQFETEEKFHVIFFDAFDANAQPELWTEMIFEKMFKMLHLNGLLVTYCSKGTVRRAMQAAGFNVEKLKGPPGKREIIRATKIS